MKKFANLFLRRPQRKAFPPRRTLNELAEELGVSMPKLRSVLNNSTTAPRPLPLCDTGGAWYDAEDVRRWWTSKEIK